MKEKSLSVIGILFAALYLAMPVYADVIDDPVPLGTISMVLILLIVVLIIIAASVLVWILRQKKLRQ